MKAVITELINEEYNIYETNKTCPFCNSTVQIRKGYTFGYYAKCPDYCGFGIGIKKRWSWDDGLFENKEDILPFLYVLKPVISKSINLF